MLTRRNNLRNKYQESSAFDKSWNGGCDVINVSGKRKGKLCNCPLYKKENGLKMCYTHYLLLIDQEPEQDSPCDNNEERCELYRFSNGDIYEGDWIGYKRDGSGRLIFANGNKYEG